MGKKLKMETMRFKYNLMILMAMAAALFFNLSCSTTSHVIGQQGASMPARQVRLERLWVRNTLSSHSPDWLSVKRLNRMAPLLTSDLIIQGNGVDSIVAYRRSDGDEVWHRNIRGGVEGGAVRKGDLLYFGGSDGVFRCISLRDGHDVWTFPVDSEVLAAPTLNEDRIYFQSAHDIVYSLIAETGKLIWLYKREVSSTLSVRAHTSPWVDDKRVYVGFSDGFLVALNKFNSAGLQQVVWEKRLNYNLRFRDIDASVVGDKSNLYVSAFDGALFAINKDNGQVIWHFEHAGGYLPVTLVGNLVIQSSSQGEVIALDSSLGTRVWSYKLKEGIATQAAKISENIVIGSSKGSLEILNARSGSLLTSFAPGRGLMATPAVDEQTKEIFFISNDANLFAMKLTFEYRSDELPWQMKKPAESWDMSRL